MQAICSHPCCQPHLVVADTFLDGAAAVAVMQNLPIPSPSGIQQTLDHWLLGNTFNAIGIRHNKGIWMFAPWVFIVWNEFVPLRHSITLWRKAVKNLTTQGDEETVEIL
jgi:hypothetical protein